jgi:peptidyl-prolyl cis-trans isomerase SurA
MNKLLSILILIFTANTFSETIVAEVGNEKISYEKIERAYEKNLKEDAKRFKELELDSAVKFIELYTKYRLKVLDAIDKGYLQDSAAKAEIANNKRLLAENFFYENELLIPKVNEIVERRKHEFKFAFIIIPFDNAEEENKKLKREKAQAALKAIKDGMSFEDAAKKYSEDGQTAQEGGLVDKWVTGGTIQKPLEDILFNLHPGEMHDEVLETSYGCFILKLVKKEPRKMLEAGHLQLGTMQEVTDPKDSLKLVKRADSLIKVFKTGVSFEKLVRENSVNEITTKNDGKYSKLYNRSTGFDGVGMFLDKNLNDALYNMKEGEISKPVADQTGIHILKLYKVHDIDIEKEFQVAKDVYKKVFFTKDKKAFMDSIAQKYGFKFDSKIAESFQTELDTNKTTIGMTWADEVSTSSKSKVLFSFNNKNYTIGDFVNLCMSNRELRGFSLSDEGIYLASKKIIENELFEIATAGLEDKYPEYKELLNEFRDGIILFKVEDEEVWSKGKFDEQLAKTYWDSTKNKYKTNHRFNVTEIYRLNETSIEEIKKQIDEGADFSKTAELKTQRDGMREKKGELGWIEQTKDQTADLIPIEEAKKGAIVGPFKNKFGWSLVRINDIEVPRVMTFEEAKPYITQPVQEIVKNNLRNAWLSKVEKNHPVKIYEDNLKMKLN